MKWWSHWKGKEMQKLLSGKKKYQNPKTVADILRKTLFSDKNIDSVRHMSGEQTDNCQLPAGSYLMWALFALYEYRAWTFIVAWQYRNIDDKYYDQLRHNKPKNDTQVVAFILTLQTNQCCTFNAQVHVRECPALTTHRYLWSKHCPLCVNVFL